MCAKMKNLSIFNYVQHNILNDYEMSVLYYYVKQQFVDNGYTLNNVSKILIDGRYLGYPLSISITSPMKTEFHSVALLLSLRLLMLNHNIVTMCEDDRLFLKSKPQNTFEWVSYMHVILDYKDDDEVKLLYRMLDNYCSKSSITDNQKVEFVNTIIVPEYKNEYTYYNNISLLGSGVEGNVICNNSFVDSTFKEYTINYNIKFVGSTAFAFCENLEKLTFEDKVLFAPFPIVECKNLKHIVVPTEWLNYYKEQLPYYGDIITDEINDSCPDSIQIPEELKDDRVEDKLDVVRNKSIYEKKKTPIDTQVLNKVFDKKVTSYKYLWFLSIISLAKESGNLFISYKNLMIRMAAIAWPYVYGDELDFGQVDCMKQYLSQIKKVSNLISGSSQNAVESYLLQHYDNRNIFTILSPLLKNVPYRFLSPWIKFTTNEDVMAKSNSVEYATLYALQDKGILLDEDWWEYIQENYDKVYLFTINAFVEYVSQYNNPLTLINLKFSKTRYK